MAKAKTTNVPAVQKPPIAEIAWPIIPTRNEIAERCAPLEARVKEVEENAAKFGEITEANSAEALEYVRLIARGETAIETRRQVYVKPANDFTKIINEVTKGFTGRMKKAREALAGTILTFQKAQQAIADAAAKAQRDAEERDAEARAKKLEAKGDTGGAQMLRDIAATAPAPKTDVRVRSGSGLKSVVTDYWRAEVVDRKAFLTALLEGKLFPYVDFVHIEVSQSALNEFAKNNKEAKDQVLMGMKITNKETLGAR